MRDATCVVFSSSEKKVSALLNSEMQVPKFREGSSNFQNQQKQQVALSFNWDLDPLGAFGLDRHGGLTAYSNWSIT